MQRTYATVAQALNASDYRTQATAEVGYHRVQVLRGLMWHNVPTKDDPEAGWAEHGYWLHIYADDASLPHVSRFYSRLLDLQRELDAGRVLHTARFAWTPSQLRKEREHA